jgi:hypothetical protein
MGAPPILHFSNDFVNVIPEEGFAARELGDQRFQLLD